MTIHLDWISVAIGAAGMFVLWVIFSMFSLLMDYKVRESDRHRSDAQRKLREISNIRQ
jgi:hypothetical protein